MVKSDKKYKRDKRIKTEIDNIRGQAELNQEVIHDLELKHSRELKIQAENYNKIISTLIDEKSVLKSKVAVYSKKYDTFNMITAVLGLVFGFVACEILNLYIIG